MTINVKSEEHIMLIEIDRPQKYNAMTREMYTQMARAYYQLDRDDRYRVGVVYANGPHFTSGLELTDWSEAFSSGAGFPLGGKEEIDPFYMMSEERCRKPIIFAVQGYCFTWGVEVMLNADIRVAAFDTRFAMLEVRRGFFPCGGATFRLVRDIGWSNAMRYLLTGDQWSAEDAYRMGLVQYVTESGNNWTKPWIWHAESQVLRRWVCAAFCKMRVWRKEKGNRPLKKYLSGCRQSHAERRYERRSSVVH